MTSADIQIDNPNMLRLKFLQVNKQANTKIEFIAGSGDFATFSVRQLIGQIVDQAQENQRYTKSMEAYVAKMQGKLRQVRRLMQLSTLLFAV